jgi:3-oxoacyl-[acyl-carrier protein] reductase
MKRTIIITGSSKGIGKAIALELAKQNVNLVLVARDQNKLLELKENIEALGSNCICVPVDLTLEGSIKTVIDKTLDSFGGIDVLINNAGLGTPGSILDTTEEQWKKLMTLNAKVPFFLSKEAIPHLSKSSRGIIINISSVVGRKGYVNQAAYTSSKHALAGFTKVLSQEVRPMGIRVHLIAPGGVATEMVAAMRPDIDAASLIQPEEIANIVNFLIFSNGNAMIDEINIHRFDAPLL